MTNKLAIIGGSGLYDLEELKNRGHEMKPLYDAVNIMQDTEWVINKRVYDVIVKLIETDNPKYLNLNLLTKSNSVSVIIPYALTLTI